MDSIRAEMKSFTRIEQGALARKDAAFQANMRLLFIIIVTASLFALKVFSEITYSYFKLIPKLSDFITQKEFS